MGFHYVHTEKSPKQWKKSEGRVNYKIRKRVEIMSMNHPSVRVEWARERLTVELMISTRQILCLCLSANRESLLNEMPFYFIQHTLWIRTKY